MIFRRPLFDESELDDATVKLVLGHLSSDLKDDWYPDPVNWRDLLTPAFIRDALTKRGGLFGLISTYKSSHREVRDVPKPNGTLRYSLEQTLLDRFAYQFSVSHLAPDLDPILSVRVLSHRAFPKRDGRHQSKRLFKPGVEQWQEFERLIASDAATKHVVEADIQSFYESITTLRVKAALQSAISSAPVTSRVRIRLTRHADRLVAQLIDWTYSSTGGLPQNRDASSFLANLVMHQVDAAMINRGYDYFRYMDDMRIRCDSESTARKALSDLCLSLRTIGLTLNSKKTRILAPGSEWHLELAKPQDTRLRDIENMWKSRSLHLISRSLKYLSELTADVITAGDVASRQFRFCVNRISRVLLCPDISYSLPGADRLRGLALDALEAHGHASAELCQLIALLKPTPSDIDRIERLLLDPGHFLHAWQRFQIGRMLIQLHEGGGSHRLSTRMILTARQVLSGTSEALPTDVAVLMLGIAGDLHDRQRIAREFHSFSSSPHLQRAAFIAMHELDYDLSIKEHVQRHVAPHLNGVLRRYKSSCKGLYCLPPRSTSLSELATNLGHYVG